MILYGLMAYKMAYKILSLSHRGAWVVQWVEHPTSAQVMISRFVGSSPTSSSELTAQSLELLRILCLPLSLPLPCSGSVSFSLSKINKHLLRKKNPYVIVTHNIGMLVLSLPLTDEETEAQRSLVTCPM